MLDLIVRKKAILVISFEDYKIRMGGVSKVIASQKKIIKKNNYTHIFLCPLHAKKSTCQKWLIRIDGKVFFVGDVKSLCLFLENLTKSDCDIKAIQLHHLKNINMDELIRILNVFTCFIYFYLHDYYSIQPLGNGNLLEMGLDNDPVYKKRKERIVSFFDDFIDRIIPIAPSDACKDIWLNYYPNYQERIKVIYHQKPTDLREGKRHLLGNNCVLKVAFLGVPTTVKGWDDFEKLSSSFKKNKRYDFFYLGNGQKHLDGVKNIKVDYHCKNKDMTSQLKHTQIDIALLLSKWPETYSYTYYESLAADDYVLAYNDSGNIQYQIANRKNGRTFKNLADLKEYMDHIDEVIQDVNNYRVSHRMIPSGYTENDEFITFLSENSKNEGNKAHFHIKKKIRMCFPYEVKCFLKHMKMFI